LNEVTQEYENKIEKLQEKIEIQEEQKYQMTEHIGDLKGETEEAFSVIHTFFINLLKSSAKKIMNICRNLNRNFNPMTTSGERYAMISIGALPQALWSQK